MKLNLQNVALTGALILANACGGQKSSISPIGKTDAKVRLGNKISTDETLASTGPSVCGTFTLRPYYFDPVTGVTPADKNNDGTITFKTGAGIPDPLANPVEGCISTSPIDPNSGFNWGYMGTFSDYTDCNTGAAVTNVQPPQGVQVQTWFTCKADVDNAADIVARVSVVQPDSAGYANIGTSVEATPVVAACKLADQKYVHTQRTIGLQGVVVGDFVTIENVEFKAIAATAAKTDAREFYVKGSDILTANELMTSINDPSIFQNAVIAAPLAVSAAVSDKIAEFSLSKVDGTMPIIGASTKTFYYDTAESFFGSSYISSAESVDSISTQQALLGFERNSTKPSALFVSLVTNNSTNDLAIAGSYFATQPIETSLPKHIVQVFTPACANPDFNGSDALAFFDNAHAECDTTDFTGDTKGTAAKLATVVVIPGKGFAVGEIADLDTIVLHAGYSTNFANLRDYNNTDPSERYLTGNVIDTTTLSISQLLDNKDFTLVSLRASLAAEYQGDIFAILRSARDGQFYYTALRNYSKLGQGKWAIDETFLRRSRELASSAAKTAEINGAVATVYANALAYPSLTEAECLGLTGDFYGCFNADDAKNHSQCSAPLACDTSGTSDVAVALSTISSACNALDTNATLSLNIPGDYCSMASADQSTFIDSYTTYANAYMACNGSCSGMQVPANCEDGSCVFQSEAETALSAAISGPDYCNDNGQYVTDNPLTFPAGFCGGDTTALTNAYEAYVTSYIACVGFCDDGMAGPSQFGLDGSTSVTVPTVCPALTPAPAAAPATGSRK